MQLLFQNKLFLSTSFPYNIQNEKTGFYLIGLTDEIDIHISR